MTPADEAMLDEHMAAENAHDLDRIMATFAVSAVQEMNGTPVEGHPALREAHRAVGFDGEHPQSFSEVRVTELRRWRAPDAIVVEQKLSARHTGPWGRMPPTGRIFSVALCTIYQFEGGRIAREHVYLDWTQIRHALTRPEPASAVAASGTSSATEN